MREVVITVLMLVGFAAHAARLEDVVAEEARAGLPVGLAVVRVIAPARDVHAGEPVRLIWRDPPKAGMTTVEVEVGGGKVWARVELGELQPVLIAVRGLAAGEEVGADDVRIETRPNRGLQIEPDAMVGAKMRRQVVTGAVLTEADVILPPPVPRGTEVTVEIRRGAVKLATPGTLETAALPGAKAVARVGSREVAGRLTSDRKVVVEGGAP
jgi:flagella basal body P-ring formation protein FlgA